MSSLDRDRLAKVLSMLAFSHDGEVVAAAKTALKFLAASGMTWDDVLQPQSIESQEHILREKLLVLSASNDQLRIVNGRLRARLIYNQLLPKAGRRLPGRYGSCLCWRSVS